MVTKTDRFGNPITEKEVIFSEREEKKTTRTDRFGNPITESSGSVMDKLDFNSTSNRPKGEREEGIIEKY